MKTLAAWQMDRKVVTDFIKAKMKEKDGLTCQNAADQMGVSYDTLNNVLNMRSELTLERTIKLSILLDTEIQEFLDVALQNTQTDFGGRLYRVLVRTGSKKACPKQATKADAGGCESRGTCEKQLKLAMEMIQKEHREELDRVQGRYGEFNRIVEKNNEEWRKMLMGAKDETIEELRRRVAAQVEQVKRLRKQKAWAVGAAVAIGVAFVAVVIIHTLGPHGGGLI